MKRVDLRGDNDPLSCVQLHSSQPLRHRKGRRSLQVLCDKRLESNSRSCRVPFGYLVNIRGMGPKMLFARIGVCPAKARELEARGPT
jgi:hypothetical protein